MRDDYLDDIDRNPAPEVIPNLAPVRRSTRKPPRGLLEKRIKGLENYAESLVRIIEAQRDYIRELTGNDVETDVDLAQELRRAEK